jgi:hypothetical protein
LITAAFPQTEARRFRLAEYRREGILTQTIPPDNTDPIPVRSAPRGMGAITIRFVGLQCLAMVVLALIWSR